MDNVTVFPRPKPPPRRRADPALPLEKRATSFAFRLPPELKAAAKALSKVRGLYRPSRNGKPGMEDWVSTYSINDALVTLATIGLEKMAEIVQANLDKATREQEAYAELMAFFLANPLTEVAKATDFPVGSPGQTLIESDGMEYGEGEDGGELGWDRNLAAQYYTSTQHQILYLTGAKGAIQKALVR